MTDRDDQAVTHSGPKRADAVTLRDFLAARQAGEAVAEPARAQVPGAVPEIGGRQDGLDPTRYGDWEKNGRCIDF